MVSVNVIMFNVATKYRETPTTISIIKKKQDEKKNDVFEFGQIGDA